MPTETDKAAGEKFTLAAATGLTKEDYTFDGWHDGAVKYDAGAEYTMPAHSVTFTAQWKPDEGSDPSTSSLRLFTNTTSAKCRTAERSNRQRARRAVP